MWVKGLQNQHVTGSLKIKWRLKNGYYREIFWFSRRWSVWALTCLDASQPSVDTSIFIYMTRTSLLTHIFTWRALLNPRTYVSQSHQNGFTTGLLSLIKQLLTIGMEAFTTFQKSRQTARPRVDFVSSCRRWGRERTYRRGRGGAGLISRHSF